MGMNVKQQNLIIKISVVTSVGFAFGSVFATPWVGALPTKWKCCEESTLRETKQSNEYKDKLKSELEKIEEEEEE